jgi:DNA-directed RNA polymerase specialized sigma24 family protein
MKLLAETKWSFFENELKGFVYKRVKDKALTEDIVHDVFIRSIIYKTLKMLRDGFIRLPKI